MKYYLVQYDQDEDIIAKTEIDINDYNSVLENVHYYDTSHKCNREEIKKWIISKTFENEDLTITGEEFEEDGFLTEVMYLEIVSG